MKKIKDNKLKIYDILRMFHKNELCEIMDKYELTEWEMNVLETLSGLLYMAESIFTRDYKKK